MNPEQGIEAQTMRGGHLSSKVKRNSVHLCEFMVSLNIGLCESVYKIYTFILIYTYIYQNWPGYAIVGNHSKISVAKSATSLFLAYAPVCVSLSKCLNLSEPQFLHPENKDYCVHLVRLLR